MNRVPGLRKMCLLALLAPRLSAVQADVFQPGILLEPTESISSASQIEVADMDGDGLPELIVSGGQHSLMWRNVDRGTLVPLPYIGLSGGTEFVADFDGDGWMEVVSVWQGGVRERESVQPFVFGPVVTLADEAVEFPGASSPADLNADGATDVIVRCGAFPGSPIPTLRTWLNDGSGGMQPSQVAASIPDMFRFSLGDVDGDGILDVAAEDGFLGEGVIGLGLGDGTFAIQPPLTLPDVANLVLGDINVDGHADLVACMPGLTEVLAGGGDGSFTLLASGVTSGFGAICAVGNSDGNARPDLLLQAAGSGLVSVHHVVGSTLVAEPGFELLQSAMAKFADFDGDGRAGAVMIGQAGTHAETLVVPGNGTGDLTVRKPLVAGTFASWPVIANVEGDARPEVIDGMFDGSPEIVVFPVPGDGSLGPPGPVTPVPTATEDIRAARLDTDGYTDLVEVSPPSVTPLRSNGDGTFTQGPSITLPAGAHPAVGDIDGDGDDDLAAPGLSAQWYPALGDGSFGPPLPMTAFGGLPGFSNQSVVIADLDGDGLGDLVGGRDLASPASLEWFHGFGTGSFAAPVDLATSAGGCSVDVIVADLDEDGHLDIVGLGPKNGPTLTVVRGDGHGGFSSPFVIPTNFAPGRVCAADVNGDGRRDLVLDGTLLQHEYEALLLQLADGSFSPPRPGAFGRVAIDLDGDGTDDLLHANEKGILAFMAHPTASFPTSEKGLMGSVGLPVLSGAGPLAAGGPVQLLLRGAAASASVQFVVGTVSELAPPGASPSTQLTVGGFTTTSDGRLVVGGHLPAALPAGFDLYVQAWIADAGASGGIAASNGLELVGR